MDSTPRSENALAADDEWTTIPRTKRRGQKSAPKPPGIDRDLTLDKLLASYDHRMQIWQASTCRRQVLQILDRKRPDGGWQIKHAICLASGSFCRDNWDCQRRSVSQFVAFMDIVKHLQASSDELISMTAKELVYAPLDLDFLAHMNVTGSNSTTNDHAVGNRDPGTSKSMPGSFVFDAFMDKTLPSVRQLFNSNPSLLVGTSSPVVGAGKTSEDEINEMRSLYQTFDTRYSNYRFPRFEEDPNVFEGLRICWANEPDPD